MALKPIPTLVSFISMFKILAYDAVWTQASGPRAISCVADLCRKTCQATSPLFARRPRLGLVITLTTGLHNL